MRLVLLLVLGGCVRYSTAPYYRSVNFVSRYATPNPTTPQPIGLDEVVVPVMASDIDQFIEKLLDQEKP